jgi:coproporphyrinogen III oxidase-like Fe-S oxidoreductase
VYGNDVNYSIDLISGLPGLSLGAWAETLETALHLDPCPVHLSIYDLQVESVRSTDGRP